VNNRGDSFKMYLFFLEDVTALNALTFIPYCLAAKWFNNNLEASVHPKTLGVKCIVQKIRPMFKKVYHKNPKNVNAALSLTDQRLKSRAPKHIRVLAVNKHPSSLTEL